MDPLALIAAELARSTAAVDPESLIAAAGRLQAAPRIFVAGAGRSGLAMRAFAMRLMHLGLPVHVLGDMTTPGIAAGDLLVIGSGSGRTASLLAAAQKATSLGADLLLLTIDPGSPIGQLATQTIRLPAPSPKAAAGAALASAQPMGALFEQTLWLVGDALVMLLMDRLGETSDSMFARHANLE